MADMIDRYGLQVSARTLRSWTAWDVQMKPQGAVMALHAAADLLDQIAALPPAPDAVEALVKAAAQERERCANVVESILKQDAKAAESYNSMIASERWEYAEELPAAIRAGGGE